MDFQQVPVKLGASSVKSMGVFATSVMQKKGFMLFKVQKLRTREEFHLLATHSGSMP